PGVPDHGGAMPNRGQARCDAELLRAARRDPSAFRELYDRYAARVYGYHLRRSGDADAAHDLAAETFAQAWLARRRFRDEAGVALERAAAHDLAAQRRPARKRRRLLLAVAAAIALPGAALAAEQLLNTDDVANSMPAGAGIFGGRHPTCTVVKTNVEYHCVLD